jgi:uncharacterized Zn finger protein
VGDELLVDDPSADEVYLVEVASVESDGRRTVVAVAAEIDTIWARAIDEVTVKIAIHDGTKTESIRMQVLGDQGFKKNKGDVVLAKDIKRIFAERVR